MPAQTVIWTGGANDDFDDRNNWDLKIIPDNLDTAIIPKTASQALGSNLDRTASGAAATGTVTFTGNAANTNTVVIDGKTYTFQTSLTDSDGNVKIGGSTEASADNLVAAITLGSGAGTAYAASTTIHSTVSAYDGAGTTVDVRAVTPGTAGNSIAMSETLVSGTVDATLSGGDTDGLYIVLLKTEDGSPAIGSSGNPLILTAAKIVLEGRETAYIRAGDNGNSTDIDRIIINSKNMVDAAVLDTDISGNARDFVEVEALSGGFSLALHASASITNYFQDGAKSRSTLTGAAATIISLFMNGGRMALGCDCTSCHQSGGTITYGNAAGAVMITLFQTGGLFIHNQLDGAGGSTRLAVAVLVNGMLDATQTIGNKQITVFYRFPHFILRKDDDTWTGDETVIGA